MALKDVLASLLGGGNEFAIVKSPDEALSDDDLTAETLEELSNGKGDDE